MTTRASWIAHGLRAAAAMAALVGASAAASAAPRVEITPDPVACDTWVYPGVWGTGTFDVRNTGDAPLAITDMRIAGVDAGMFGFDPLVDPSCQGGQDCAVPYTLAAGEVRRFGLTCAPDQPGSFTASLTITSNAASGNPTVGVTCQLGPPEVSVSPSPLTFPIVRAERDGAIETLTIANVATPPAAPFDFTIDGPPWRDPVAFSVVGSPCNTTCELAPGESQTYTITFKPYNTDAYTSPIVITNQFPSWGPATIEVPLFAQGGLPRLEFVDPPGGTLALGAVPVGQSTTGTITATDAGPVDMFVWNVSTDSADVALVDGPSYQFTVAPGAHVSWTVSCTPRDFSGGFGRVVFDTDSELGTYYAHVNCGGLGASLALDRGQILFGEVAVGESATVRVRVSNQGNQATTLTATDSDDPRFHAALVGATLPVALAAGDFVDVDVTFAPTDRTSAAAWISFAASAGTGAQLRVFGDTAAVSPGAYDFGVVAYPDTPAHGFVLSNGGELPVTIASVTLDAPADFAIAGLAVGTVIAPSASLAFQVGATPSRLGRRHATLAIGYGGLAAVPVPLDAIATDPALAVTTGDATADDYALDAGAVDVDVGAHTAHVTLRDDGAAPIAITACAITGDAAFTLASACPFTIAAGASADVAIAFDPDAEASDRGALVLDGTGFATGALTIELAGTGLDQHVALSTLALDFPDTFRHPTAPASAVVTVHNTAGIALPLTTIAVDGDGFALGGPTSALLAPGDGVDVAVTFAPDAVGAFSGHLVLGNADDPAIARIALGGRGIDRSVEVTPVVVDLGDVEVGAAVRLSERGGAIAVRDVDPAASFAIREVAIAGDDGWRVIGPDRGVIAPGEAATVDVELTPSVAGPHAATIDVFLDQDPVAHARIAITARAVPATEPPGGGGCGCAGGGGGGWIAVAIVAIGLRRRRRV